ncbi:hypothetical protein KY362_07535 [Candidatus Woesearchaeota archaeon]|nr:hypothetical protein [Candidatus Woesearchaeota archaeon]
MRRGPMWIIESSGEVFSKYLISYLGDIIKKQGLELNPDVVFATLSTPKDKTVAGEEKVDFLKIAAALAEDADDEKIRAAVKEHADKYRWIPYGISGPAWDNSHFVKEMKVLLKKGKAAVQSELNTIKSEPEHIQKQKDDILRVLDIDEQHMRLIRIAEGTIYGKAYSKDALFFGFFAAERLYLEMAERLGIDLRMIRHMMPSEIIDCLKGAPLDRDDIKERCRRSVIYVEEGRPKVYSGKAAEDFLASLDIEEEEEIDPEVTELKGSCARQGYGTGKVKIINTADDVPKMQEGDVLVSHMTDPEIVVAMKKASAIVTDMGGIICHAAIVSRELGIPCVIGTKHATKVLKDGQTVEVDADNGIVKILEGDDAGQ